MATSAAAFKAMAICYRWSIYTEIGLGWTVLASLFSLPFSSLVAAAPSRPGRITKLPQKIRFLISHQFITLQPFPAKPSQN
jgi:hypothetical protein